MKEKRLTKYKNNGKLRLKHFEYNLQAVGRARQKNMIRKNEQGKKLFNFIVADDYMKKFNCGEKFEHVEDYHVNLYSFEDMFITSYNKCAFVQQIHENQLYSIKDSAGILGRVDSPDMTFTQPVDISGNNHIEEDEICLLAFILDDNYWHYIFDIVPRLMIMIKRGYKGKFLINNATYAKPFLELLSIPPERLIINEYGKIIHARKVYLFGEIYGIELRDNLLEDTRKYLIHEAEKKHGALKDKTFPKRIYVTRVSRRKIINEQEIVDFLRSVDFEIIVPEELSIYEQMKYFHNADVIVTPHGANSANLLFAQEGATFVECFGHMWINPCMINTVQLLDIDYHMLCERLADYDAKAHKFSDYVINPVIMDCKIKKILEFRALAYDEDFLPEIKK